MGMFEKNVAKIMRKFCENFQLKVREFCKRNDKF